MKKELNVSTGSVQEDSQHSQVWENDIFVCPRHQRMAGSSVKAVEGIRKSGKSHEEPNSFLRASLFLGTYCNVSQGFRPLTLPSLRGVSDEANAYLKKQNIPMEIRRTASCINSSKLELNGRNRVS